MHFLATLPIVLSTMALLLALLCIFAGSQQGFMTEYSILTVSLGRCLSAGCPVSLTYWKLSLIHRGFAKTFRLFQILIRPI
jgi:hypothetical protein